MTGHEFLMLAMAGHRNPEFWSHLGAKHIERLSVILSRARVRNDRLCLSGGALVAIAGIAWLLFAHPARSLMSPDLEALGKIQMACVWLLAGGGCGWLLGFALRSPRIQQLQCLLTPLRTAHPSYAQALVLLQFESPRRYRARVVARGRNMVMADVECMQELAAQDRRAAEQRALAAQEAAISLQALRSSALGCALDNDAGHIPDCASDMVSALLEHSGTAGARPLTAREQLEASFALADARAEQQREDALLQGRSQTSSLYLPVTHNIRRSRSLLSDLTPLGVN